jgi:molybdopterin synthase catalytic subunit
MKHTSIIITHESLNVNACQDFVADPSCGAISLFVGTVRNTTANKKVNRLEFSAYESMALKEMDKIANQVLRKFEVKRIAIHHAVGMLELGDIPVVIAVSSAHRKAAFEGCQYAIDTLKKTVPIWKREIFDDGDIWVNAHP